MPLLEKLVGKQVLVVLKGGVRIRGQLRCFDIHINLLLEQAERLHKDGSVETLGTILIRGDNVVAISPIEAIEIEEVSE
ncbi:RNA-binding protein [archaeon]|nr:RNA-binding protein [archaeon]